MAIGDTNTHLPESYSNMLADIMANRSALDHCTGHSFERVAGVHGWRTGAYQCTVCGGLADSSAVYWYRRGLFDAQEKAPKENQSAVPMEE